MSCQPCGCDPEENDYKCERHAAETFLCKAYVAPATLPSGELSTAPTVSKGTAEWRKQRPLWSGVLNYFPDALLEVANVSWIGNEQHNPGQELHWDRSKSRDEKDACARHLIEAGTRDSDGTRHSAKVAWRALAMLQKEIENDPST